MQSKLSVLMPSIKFASGGHKGAEISLGGGPLAPLEPPLPVRGVPVGIAPPRVVWKKLEWLGYHMVKKFEDIFICFGATHERDRRTDRQKDTA